MTLKTIFEPVFGSIITLIDKQIEMIVATKLKPKVCYIVLKTDVQLTHCTLDGYACGRVW